MGVATSIVESVFLRNGSEGTYTKLYTNFDEQELSTVMSLISLQKDESPIIVCLLKNWLVITNQKTIWYTDEGVKTLDHSQLVDATIDRSLAIKRGVMGASDLEDIKLITKNNTDITIHIERGQPFSGIWNVLKFLASRDN